jgi:D-3-phosphoglycerate dehydrogenase
MKRGNLLINSASCGFIDEEALVKIVDEGYLRGAALDVFEGEPEVRPRLRGHPGVPATPHIAGSTETAEERVGVEPARSLSDWWDHRLGD